MSSWAIPYVSFRGQTLANHGYVNLRLVGRPEDGGGGGGDGGDDVQCITDLSSCCSGTDGVHRGLVFP